MTQSMALIGKKKIDILHTESSAVTTIDDEIRDLAFRMVETCKRGNGYALAAVQVGIPINLIVTSQGEGFVNIEVETSGEIEVAPEGCLSIPGRWYMVPRFNKAKIIGQRISGQTFTKDVENFEARIWQHENDHLLGKLISEEGYEEFRGNKR